MAAGIDRESIKRYLVVTRMADSPQEALRTIAAVTPSVPKLCVGFALFALATLVRIIAGGICALFAVGIFGILFGDGRANNPVMLIIAITGYSIQKAWPALVDDIVESIAFIVSFISSLLLLIVCLVLF
jgi:hypothetical protein